MKISVTCSRCAGDGVVDSSEDEDADELRRVSLDDLERLCLRLCLCLCLCLAPFFLCFFFDLFDFSSFERFRFLRAGSESEEESVPAILWQSERATAILDDCLLESLIYECKMRTVA